MKLLIRFWVEYAYKHRVWYTLGILCLLATNGLSVLIPKLIQWAIESFENQESAWIWGVALLGAGIGTMVVRTLSRTLIFNPGREIEYEVKKSLFERLLQLPQSFFETQMSAGEIITEEPMIQPLYVG